MAKVITISRTFPAYHPRAGKQTYFVEQVMNALSDMGIYMQFNHLVDLNEESILLGKFTKDDLWYFWSRLDLSHVDGRKLYTIRAKTVKKKTKEVVSRWKQGDKASLRVWGSTPYYSPQIIIAPDVELVKVADFKIVTDRDDLPWMDIGTKYSYPSPFDMERSIIPDLAKNDGLNVVDLLAWFKYPKPFDGQILCWKEVPYA